LICLRVVQKSERTSGNMRGIKGKVDKQRVFGVSGGEDENISDGRRSWKDWSERERDDQMGMEPKRVCMCECERLREWEVEITLGFRIGGFDLFIYLYLFRERRGCTRGSIQSKAWATRANLSWRLIKFADFTGWLIRKTLLNDVFMWASSEAEKKS
jgi:hypothetical protein